MYNLHYPYVSGSQFTASYALTASYAISASAITFASSSTSASVVLSPVSGASAAVNICIISYEDYLKLIPSSPTYNPNAVEICNFPP
jgi:hypothetical protein